MEIPPHAANGKTFRLVGNVRNRLLLFLVALLCTDAFLTYALGQSVVWEHEQQISFGTTQAYSPRVFAEGDTIHIFWIIPNSAGCYYVRSTDGGGTFSSPRDVYAGSGVNSGTTRNIAFCGNHLYVLWGTCDTCDTQHDWTTLRRSIDAGVTFEPSHRWFPSATDNSITAYDSAVVFRWSSRLLTQEWLAQSFDHGVTWHSEPFWFEYYQKLHLEEHDLHLMEAAHNTQRLEIAYRHSSDFGSTWTNQLILSTTDNYVSDVSSADIKTHREGSVQIVWTDGKYGSTNGFTGSILARRSTDRGTTWEGEQCLTDVPSGITPNIGIDNGITGVVWSNEDQPFHGVSLRLRYDVGNAWLPLTFVSDSTIQVGSPHIAISREKLHIVWSDGRSALSQIYLRSGTILPTSLREDEPTIPIRMQLHQNYPNPFNPTTTIRYALPQASFVMLTVCNTLGQQVAQLANEQQQAGYHDVVFRGEGLASGVYFYRIQAGDFVASKKLLLLK